MATLLLKDPQRVHIMSKRIYKYLAGTTDLSLLCTNQEEMNQLQQQNFTTVAGHFDLKSLLCYTDASFAPSGMHSQDCFTVTWGGTPIFWRCSKQPFPTLSTCECELVAAVEGYTALQSVHALINEFCFEEEIKQVLLIDNSAAKTIITGDNISWRTRHLKIRSSVIKDRQQSGEIEVLKVDGEHQLADLGTKTLLKDRLRQLCTLWSLQSISKPSTVKLQSTVISGADRTLARTLIHLAIASSFPSLTAGHDIGQLVKYDQRQQLVESFNSITGEVDGITFTLWLMVLVGMATTICKLSNISTRCWRYGFIATLYYLLNIKKEQETQTDLHDDMQTITVATSFRGQTNTDVYHWNPSCRKKQVLNHPVDLRRCEHCKTDGRTRFAG
jgi:hypothetical protein